MYSETLYFFTNILATSSRVYMNAGIQYSMQRVINTSTLLVNYWGATAVVVRNCDLFRVLWWSLDWQQQKFHVLHDFLLHCQWWISCYLLLALPFRYIYINDIRIQFLTAVYNVKQRQCQFMSFCSALHNYGLVRWKEYDCFVDACTSYLLILLCAVQDCLLDFARY